MLPTVLPTQPSTLLTLCLHKRFLIVYPFSLQNISSIKIHCSLHYNIKMFGGNKKAKCHNWKKVRGESRNVCEEGWWLVIQWYRWNKKVFYFPELPAVFSKTFTIFTIKWIVFILVTVIALLNIYDFVTRTFLAVLKLILEQLRIYLVHTFNHQHAWFMSWLCLCCCGL